MNCINNLKQIGLSFRVWAMDNGGQFPFHVSTNAGGTREFCAPDSDGFDTNAALHFLVMSNELSTPILLVCPEDWSRKRAATFSSLQASNVSYRVRSGTNLNESNPTGVLVFCPIDGNTLHCDGSVTEGKPGWKPPGRVLLDVLRYKVLEPLATAFPVIPVAGLVLLWVGSRLKWAAKGGPKPQGLILGEVLLLILAILMLGLILFGTVCF